MVNGEKLANESLAEMLQALVSVCAKAANNNEQLLTIDELAGHLQLSVPVVRDYVNTGKIPVVGFDSRTWRFRWPRVLEAVSRR